MDVSEDSCIALERENVRHRDFSGRRLMQFCTIGGRLDQCRFDGATIDDAAFGAGRAMTEIVECSFDGASLRMGPGGFARFVRCSFRGVQIRDWFCFGLELIDCIFSGSLRGCFFNGTVPKEHREILGRQRNEFHGNDFSAADLVDVGFRTGIDLTQQRLPTRPEYLYLPNAAVTLAKTELDVRTWENLALQQSALRFLKVYSDDVNVGSQQQLLLRADNYYRYKAPPRDMIDRIFMLLRANA